MEKPPPSFDNSQSLFNTPNQPVPQHQPVSKQSILELYNNPMTNTPIPLSVSHFPHLDLKCVDGLGVVNCIP